ncbi:E3 ubiquitin-protein ligase RHF2A-like isoform X2 [Cornus florida]|uniref:E3 ubiquitin-protein ligase RHF2A-like isoform X2 n=1 Tax=Cornus florida TaxID=4283 RepID=UPI00289D385E|nr:E3 ubiquitin-protein ligase RHF2A-like isoform X2 [Cornus florida]
MEVPGMDEVKKTEGHLTSAAAFVEGGIQDACDDACSICLEAFCESDPSTVTNCKHEFHLQCVLEWCQRSSHCPMCWQPISLKDPTSQELLEAVERERSLRFNPSRNATIFHHPTLGDFELQHLPMGVNDAELEERIIQHLAAAAAMGRTHHIARREGSRSRSSAHGRPQFLVFSPQPNAPPAAHVSASLAPVGGGSEPPAITVDSPSVPLTDGVDEPQFTAAQTDQISASSSGSVVTPTNRQRISVNNRSASQSFTPNQDRAGPSDLQSFSDSLKSRFSSMSMRYKESISKSTKGWKERLFSRSTSMADIGSDVRREVNAGIASVSRMMERLETRENSRAGRASVSHDVGDYPVTEQSNQNNAGTRHGTPLNDNNTAALAASSVSN